MTVNIDTGGLYAILISAVLIAFLSYKRARVLGGKP
jgi:hypothetical protein